jgi:hypothetical protein
MDKEYFLAKLGRFYDLSNIRKNSRKEKAINALHLKANFGTYQIIEKKGIPVAFRTNKTFIDGTSMYRLHLITFSIDEMRDFTISRILKE